MAARTWRSAKEARDCGSTAWQVSWHERMSDTHSMPMGVLFMQSQAFFGADSAIHAELMKYFDRSAVEVHVAQTTDEPSDPRMSAFARISAIPNVSIRRTSFGPSVHGMAHSARVGKVLQGGQALMRLAGLAVYIKRRNAFYGVLLGKLTGARSVIHMHVGYDDWLARTVKWALGQADAIVAISRFVAESLAAAGY